MTEGRLVDRAFIDYVFVPKRIHGRLLDVNVCTGEGRLLSDHVLVESHLKIVGCWRSAGNMEGVRSVLKVSERNNSVKKREYQESLSVKCEVLRGGDVDSMEEFRDIVCFVRRRMKYVA